MARLVLSPSQTLRLNLTISFSSSSHYPQTLNRSPFNPYPVHLFHHSKHKTRAVHCVSINPIKKSDSHATSIEVVVSLLQEFGASEKDSIFIASNSPKYIEMIVDSVSELDSSGLWSSWGNGLVKNEEEIEIDELEFEKKVYYMAKSKGDKGILPFLESLGVKLSSAKVIVSYLWSENLPELIDKVRYLREVLFSNSGYEEFTGKNAKRMMLNLSIFADEEIQSTLSFFQKMEARHGGLCMLGNINISFPFIIEAFPRLLTLSVEKHFKPLLEFLGFIGVPKNYIASTLLCFPPIIFYKVEKTFKLRVLLLEKVWENKEIGIMLSKYPWILSRSILANYDELIKLFLNEKVPKTAIDYASQRWPHILGCSVQRMKLKLNQFEELGVRKKMLVPVITSSPQLLLKKPNDFSEVVLLFKEMGFDRFEIGKILRRSPEIFALNIENTLKRKIKFLIDFGFRENQIPRIVKKFPELLLLDTNKTILPRLEYFMSIGLSKGEVCSMVYRFSPLVGYNTENVIKPKLDYLLNTMKKPLKEIVAYPRYFSYSLEKRIKRRFFIIKSRNIKCSLGDMFMKNDDEFAEEYLGFGHLLIVPPRSPPKHL